MSKKSKRIKYKLKQRPHLSEYQEGQLLQKAKIQGVPADMKGAKEPKALVFQHSLATFLEQQGGLRKPTEIGFETLDSLARNLPIAAVCIDTLKHEITKLKWDLIPKDKLKLNDADYEYVLHLLMHPNRNRESFRTLMEGTVTNLLKYDAAPIEKVRNRKGQIVELWVRSGMVIRPAFDEHGVAGNPAYQEILDERVVAEWSNYDMIYMMSNPQYDPNLYGYGLAPLENVIFAVSSLLMAESYNSSFFSQSTVPPAIINVGAGVPAESLEQFRMNWMASLAGPNNKWATPIVAFPDLDIKMLRGNNMEMQFMEYVNWLERIVIAAFGMSPQDVGKTQDVNRANGDVQERLSKNKGLKSIQNLIKEYINAEIIADLGFDDQFEFDWIETDQIDAITQADIDAKYVTVGIKTRNEVRVRLGDDPVLGGEQLNVLAGMNLLPLDTTPLTELSDEDIRSAREIEEIEESPDEDATDVQELEDSDKENGNKTGTTNTQDQEVEGDVSDTNTKQGGPKPKNVANKNPQNGQTSKKALGNYNSSLKKKSIRPIQHHVHEATGYLEETEVAKHQITPLKEELDIEKRMQTHIQSLFKVLAYRIRRQIVNDPNNKVFITKEDILLPIGYYKELAQLGQKTSHEIHMRVDPLENEDKLIADEQNLVRRVTNSTGSQNNQKDSAALLLLLKKRDKKIATRQKWAAGIIAINRNAGIAKILDDKGTVDKNATINNYLGVDENGGNYKRPAEMIASTEGTWALNTGLLIGAESAGQEMVNWITQIDACPICLAIADGNPYPPEEAYSMYPPHSNCQCVIV